MTLDWVFGEVLNQSIAMFTRFLPHQLGRIADKCLLQLALLLQFFPKLHRKIATLCSHWPVFIVYVDVAAVLAKVVDNSFAIFPCMHGRRNRSRSPRLCIELRVPCAVAAIDQVECVDPQRVT